MLNAGEYEAAVYAFSAAITLDPDHWTAYFRRAEAHRQLGLEEQANADLEKAQFLMAAARQETPEGRGFPDDAVTNNSVCGILGAIVGGIIGGIIGGLGGYFCYYLFIICSPVFGIGGGIVGGLVGGILGELIDEAIHRRPLRDRVDSSGQASAVSGSLGCLGYSGLGAVAGVIAIIALFILAAIFR